MVKKAELYTSGKYRKWNLKVCPTCTVWEIAIVAIENFSKSPVGAYTIGVQVKSGMYDDSHPDRCALVQTAELYTTGKCLNWNLKNSYGAFFKVTCGSVHKVYR